ncbi:SPOSA6832_00859, partial [Sporobolomyces salmonicolor]
MILPSANPPLSITSLTPSAGYTFSDGLVIPGPIIIFDGAVFMWDVDMPKPNDFKGEWQGWNPEKLKVFEVVSPRPEILLVGTGPTGLFPPPAFKNYLNRLGIQVDVLDSPRDSALLSPNCMLTYNFFSLKRNAASTYNLLSEEGRRVAAALYPVSELSARTGLVA